MLTQPHFGWVEWDLPNFYDRVSYIDDFPFMVFEALLKYFESGESQNVTFDAEGWYYTFTFNEDVKVGEKVICDSTVKFAEEFIKDINKDLHYWANFARNGDSAYYELVELIDNLEKYLSKQENPFVKFLATKLDMINNPDLDEDIRNRYFKEFEKLNTTTSSIYDLGDLDVLIILKDGTNLTSWSDVKDKSEVLYVSEDLSDRLLLSGNYSNLVSLESIIVKGISDKISDLSSMFSNCNSLKYILGLHSWDSSNLKSIKGMFFNCYSLNDISFLDDLNVSNVKSMGGLFQNCILLSDISPLESWDVSNVENMHGTFALCENLTSLKGLKSWNVGNVKTMESMFHGCVNLKDISYLRDWKLDNIENMFEMFRECSSLENIYALHDWNIESYVNVESTFKYTNLSQMPKWYLNSEKEIEDYINGIEDEESLIDIACYHSDFIVRKFAIEKITDEVVLKELIEKNTDTGILEAAVNNENLKDMEFLFNILKQDDSPSERGLFIVMRIDDEDYLTRIANGDFLLGYRIRAINKISDKSVLEDIANNGKNTTVCSFSLNRLNSL